MSAVSLILLLLVSVAALLFTARKRAVSVTCANTITSICLGAELWADEHGGRFPTNFICMSNELNTPKILSCLPARRAVSWTSFVPETNSTYQIVAPGMAASDTNVFLRCTVHGHLGFSDGTVFDGVRRRTKFP